MLGGFKITVPWPTVLLLAGAMAWPVTLVLAVAAALAGMTLRQIWLRILCLLVAAVLAADCLLAFVPGVIR